MLTDLFQKIGFNEKEAAVYTVLYQRGPNPVSTLAKLTGIKRTSVYDILKNLLEKGLILNFHQGATTYFAVDDVQKLYFDQKEKIDYAEKIIQELKTLPLKKEELQINFYKGKEGYREMHEDILRHKPKEIMGWMNFDNFYQGIGPRDDLWTKERIAKGIHVRLILQDSAIARKMKKESGKLNREIKIISSRKFPFESSCNIYENHIVFFHNDKKNFTCVRIHNAAFYQLQKEIFEMSWQQ